MDIIVIYGQTAQPVWGWPGRPSQPKRQLRRSMLGQTGVDLCTSVSVALS
jgi:hypothetical protein